MFTTGACSKNERGIHLQCDRSADEQGSGGKAAPVATLKYLYRKDGMIAGRVVDGKYQMYKYDKRGQLLQVADMQGNVAEKYVYDLAGNILSKTIVGKTTSYTYDKANQLVSSVYDGKTTHYEYDAAGRMVKEGGKSYEYGWLDKVLSVSENGQKVASFNYHNDGQIAQAIRNGKSEDFLWDGLALIHRGGTSFVNEPYVTGGNPILSSKDGVMFNDMLGSTLNIGGKTIHMTAFGESADTNAMYTGKPYIGELGYAFLFRNYRADQGKWQTTDPLGYPDGWNNLAYCGSDPIVFIDKQGDWAILVGAVAGGVIGGISAYITSGGDFSATVAGTLRGVVGGALAGTGIPSASMIGGAVASGLTTAFDRYANDGELSKQDVNDIAISATIGAVLAGTAGGVGKRISDGIETVYAGNITPQALAAMEGLSAGVTAEMGNVLSGLTLELKNKILSFIEKNGYLYE